jgi:peptide deformylase
MSLLPLCHDPHPVLRAPARPVAAFTPEIRRLAKDMIETMYDHDGIGLAAPQVGCDLQLFIANPTQEFGRELVMANPVLEIVRGKAAIVEGCLSLPNVWERVRRAAHVRMSGRDLSGRAVTIDADGLLAIVLQHEYDHLQGRLLIDRLSWFRRRRLGAKARRATA